MSTTAQLKPKLSIQFLDGLGSRGSASVAFFLILAIALADDVTGYQMRLSILYLLPIALASWRTSTLAGFAFAILSCLIWFISFSTNNLYVHQGYFLWEALVMLLGFLTVAFLITRLRRALGQANERFFRLVEEMHAAIFVADEYDGRVIYANPEMIKIIQTPANLNGDELQRIFVPDTDAMYAPADGKSASPIVRNTANGRYYLKQERMIPWESEKQSVLTVLSDITEHREARLLREKHREILHQVSQQTMLAEIASSISHEINQPLMAIATYTDACQRLLGRQDCDHDEISKVVGKCHVQAVRASRVIERMRDFIRHPSPCLEPCDAKGAVDEALGILQPAIEHAGVEVDTMYAENCVVCADKTLLVQILVNLIRNAIDAMQGVPLGRRLLSISVRPEISGEIRFSVTDRGTGLDTAKFNEIFQPFFTTKADGLGLGLSISRSIARSHGGTLWVSASDGVTTFNLTLAAWKSE
jgi:signal transduction histidine kinase